MSPSGAVSTLPDMTNRGASPAGRIKVLEQIAIHYQDLVQPTFGALEPGGDGAGIPLMPATYTATVREFERLAKAMRDDRHRQLIQLPDGSKASVRQLAWHLREYHLNATRTIRHQPIVKKRHGKPVRLLNADGTTATRPVTRMQRHPQSNEHLANLALGWIAAHWGLVTEPMLPNDLRDAA